MDEERGERENRMEWKLQGLTCLLQARVHNKESGEILRSNIAPDASRTAP